MKNAFFFYLGAVPISMTPQSNDLCATHVLLNMKYATCKSEQDNLIMHCFGIFIHVRGRFVVRFVLIRNNTRKTQRYAYIHVYDAFYS